MPTKLQASNDVKNKRIEKYVANHYPNRRVGSTLVIVAIKARRLRRRAFIVGRLGFWLIYNISIVNVLLFLVPRWLNYRTIFSRVANRGITFPSDLTTLTVSNGCAIFINLDVDSWYFCNYGLPQK